MGMHSYHKHIPMWVHTGHCFDVGSVIKGSTPHVIDGNWLLAFVNLRRCNGVMHISNNCLMLNCIHIYNYCLMLNCMHISNNYLVSNCMHISNNYLKVNCMHISNNYLKVNCMHTSNNYLKVNCSWFIHFALALIWFFRRIQQSLFTKACSFVFIWIAKLAMQAIWIINNMRKSSIFSKSYK